MTKPNYYEIKAKSIEFQSYNLFFSSLHKNRILTLDRINAVDLKTSPHSLIIDNREIVFLNHDDTNSLEAFATRNQIPQSQHLDTWSIILRNYLDTHLEKKIIADQDRQLEIVGISQGECENLSREIRWTMLGTMEWAYLGLWDVLALKQHRNPFYRFIGEKFYWRTMEVALRGCQHQRQQT